MWIARGRRVRTYEGEPWAMDNGAYRDWVRGEELDVEAYRLRIFKALREATHAPLFAVLPDSPGEAEVTYELAWFALDCWPDVNVAWYYALQDGVTEPEVRRLAPHIAGLFLGGTDRFKRYEAARWAALAAELGLAFHYGRCGTPSKVRHALAVGASSIDSALPLMSPKHWARFEKALEDDGPQLELTLR